jgi:hypothetical protein
MLYDVSTLYFETDAGDGFRESRFSKERQLVPQITIGPLTSQDGFPPMVPAFEGNKAVLDHAPGDRILHGRSPAPRGHRGRGRGHGDRGESEGDRGRRPVVHPRHEDPMYQNTLAANPLVQVAIGHWLTVRLSDRTKISRKCNMRI